MHLDKLPRFPLAHLPTPLENLTRLSGFLNGPALLIKRDDQTGLALGGNKTRKLEFLIAEALELKADTVITAGAAQSNHCRQTAAAAARAGLGCELVVNGKNPEVPNGNLLLDQIFGAKIHWVERPRRAEKMSEVADRLRGEGRRPYVIPVGGSNAVGAAGYVVAMMELVEQLKAQEQRVDHIVFASSSGGTHAGMAVGARASGFAGTLHGVGIDKGEGDCGPYESELTVLANETARLVGLETEFKPEDFTVVYGYVGGGYGVVGDLEREAIGLLAQQEGIVFDPVYAGRAMGALIDMVRLKKFTPGETVLFWHTGGAPALFAYASDVVERK